MELEQRKKNVGKQLEIQEKLQKKICDEGFKEYACSNFKKCNEFAYKKKIIPYESFKENKSVNKTANESKHEWGCGCDACKK